MQVLQRSVNKADSRRGRFQWPEKNKTDEQLNSEILVADSDSESGSEASNFEVSFEEEEEEKDQQ